MSPPYFDWRLLADKHRPTDPAIMAAEIRHLRKTGLKPRDIATALRVDLGVVLSALSENSIR